MKIIRKENSLQSKSLRIRKRRKIFFITSVFCSIPVLLFAGISWISYLDVFQIYNVKVKGDLTLPGGMISSSAIEVMNKPIVWFFSRRTALTYPREMLLAQVLSYGLSVKDVSVHLQNMNTVLIDIVERTPVASWCFKDQCLLLDETGLGYRLGISSSTPSFIYTATSSSFGIGERIADEGYFRDFMDLLPILAEVKLSPTYIEVSGQGDITMETGTSSPRLVLAFGMDMDKLEERLIALVEDNSFKKKLSAGSIEYIDLRFGNKMYYKERTLLP